MSSERQCEALNLTDELNGFNAGPILKQRPTPRQNEASAHAPSETAVRYAGQAESTTSVRDRTKLLPRMLKQHAAPVSAMHAMRRQGRNHSPSGMGWAADAGAGVAGVSNPLGRNGARLICSEVAVRLMQSLQALRPCWQSEGCLQALIEPVSTLRLWVTGLAVLEQRAPYAHHLRGCGFYQSRLRKLREFRRFGLREVVFGQFVPPIVIRQRVLLLRQLSALFVRLWGSNLLFFSINAELYW